MAVAVDATGTVNSSAVNATSFSSSTIITVGSGSNRALIAMLGTSGSTNTATLPSMTWNGTAMTLITSITYAGANKGSLWLFGLRNPTSGAQTLAGSWTGSTGHAVEAISFTGVDQTSDAIAFPHPNTGTATNVTATLAITSATGNIPVAMVGANNISAPNQTQIYLDAVTNDDTGGQRAAGAASVTFTWSTSGGASLLYGIIGCDIAAASAAAATKIAWFEPPDDLKSYSRPVRDAGALPAYVRPPTVFTPVSGIPWQGPRYEASLPPKDAFGDAPVGGGAPTAAASTISGIAWYEPPADKPTVKVSQDTAPPAFGKAPFTVPGVAWTEPPDRDRLPVKVNQDSAPPAYGVFVPAVGVSGIGWFNPPDRDKPSVKVSQDATPPAYGRFIPAVGISGNGWFLPLEIGQPKAKVESNPPAFGQPITTPVPISGIAWDTLHETDILPKGKYLTDPVAVPYAPQTSTWSFLVGDTTFIRDAPIDVPPTLGTVPTAAVTVPVSGIAWYTQTDQTKVRVSFDQPPAHVLRPFAAVNTNAGIPWFEPPDRDRPATKIWIEAFPAIQLRPTSLISGIGWFEPPDVDKKPVRINGEAQPGFAVVPPPVPISGMAWYEPADRDRPVLKVSIESSPAFAVFAPAPPVGVSGMAWFAPKPDSVVVQVSFSQAPALQQPIVQLVPPPDDGTRGSETILTDRRGAGQFTRRQYDEFLKAKRAAEHKARLLKKKPGAELRKAIEVAEEAVAKAGLLGDIAPSIEPITDALFDAADANVAQVAAEAREAIRIADALLLQMDEEREEEAVLMLLLTS